MVDVIGIGLISLTTTWSLYQDFDPTLFVIFVSGLTFSEIFVQLRWRMSLPCPHCGFDPLLYVRDSAKAAQQVKDYVAEKRSEAESILKPDPLRHLEKIKL